MRVFRDYAPEAKRDSYANLLRVHKRKFATPTKQTTSLKHLHVYVDDYRDEIIREIFCSKGVIAHEYYLATTANFMVFSNVLCNDITHFITSNVEMPCFHLLVSILNGVWILPMDWVKKSINHKKAYSELGYEFSKYDNISAGISKNVSFNYYF